MITIKAIQTSFVIRNKQGELKRNNYLGRRGSIICLSKSSDGSDSETPQGDTKKQELLARIAHLQTQKVRLTDYLDERSDFLTQFAEEASAEIDMIGENALKELDEAGTRILGNIESKMRAFEESMEMNKSDIENSERIIADFEEQIEDDRNEGLFFKNLRTNTPVVDKEKAKEETEKIKEITKRSAESAIRRNVYLALIGLIVIGILDAVNSSSSPDWQKVAILGAVLIGLISQLTYEQTMLLKSKRHQQMKEDNKPE